MNTKKQVTKYILFDWLAAIGSWTFFFIYRKQVIEAELFHTNWYDFADRNYFIGIACIPAFWISLYVITGYYNKIFRKSRLKELLQTLGTSLFGALILFFTLVLNDFIRSYKDYYLSFFVLFGVHFALTEIFRYFITSHTAHKIHNKEWGFKTLVVGSGKAAKSIIDEINDLPESPGNIFTGCVTNKPNENQTGLHALGSLSQIQQVIEEHEVEEVIIALNPESKESINEVLKELSMLDLVIKVIPGMYDILSGSVKMNSIFGAALIEISFDIMPSWQRFVKRGMDVFISLFCLIIGFPVFLVTAFLVKRSSKGPIFFKQERIGLHGKPFQIIKFRSMYTDAEKSGPQLSSSSDSRITPWGKIMRKTRLDEIPQFYNVLIGEMTLVGPRPERQFYIDKIMEKAPHYYHLTKVKPGITSWGQVKYGYAENVDEMVQRLKYDLIYLENMSLIVDLKIMIYTVLIVLQRKGK